MSADRPFPDYGKHCRLNDEARAIRAAPKFRGQLGIIVGEDTECWRIRFPDYYGRPEKRLHKSLVEVL